MRLIQGMLALFASAMLAACGGGGGNAGTCSFGCTSPDPGTSVAKVDMIAS